MRLMFIEEDGSMGLRHGQVYNVAIRSYLDHIVVEALEPNSEWRRPYSSPQTFAANWIIERGGK